MNWIKKKDSKSDFGGGKSYPFAKWMSWLFLIMSLSLFIYTAYRSEIVFHGSEGNLYGKYYLISIIGIIFWVVVLRLKDAIRVNIIIIALSIFVGLYMVEWGLILLGLGQPYDYRLKAVYAAADKAGVEFDKRSRLNVIEDFITDGVDAVPAVSPKNVLFLDENLLPLGGVSNKVTVAGNENGYYMTYLSDRYGFNNPDSEWDSAQVEWMLIGDSFTEGESVHPGEDISGQIRSITQENVINIGRSSNGPLIELATLMEYAKSTRPEKVIWLYYEGNDLKGNLRNYKKNPILIKYMQNGFSQNLIRRQSEIDNKLNLHILQEKSKVKANIRMQDKLYKTRWIRLNSIRNLIGFDNENGVKNEVVELDPLFSKIIKKAKLEVETWGGKLYFVYLPEYYRYKNKHISNDNFRKKLDVINIVRELKIPVIDIHKEVFNKHHDPLAFFPFGLSGHYNASGYSAVAKAIVKNINKLEKK